MPFGNGSKLLFCRAIIGSWKNVRRIESETGLRSHWTHIKWRHIPNFLIRSNGFLSFFFAVFIAKCGAMCVREQASVCPECEWFLKRRAPSSELELQKSERHPIKLQLKVVIATYWINRLSFHIHVNLFQFLSRVQAVQRSQTVKRTQKNSIAFGFNESLLFVLLVSAFFFKFTISHHDLLIMVVIIAFDMISHISQSVRSMVSINSVIYIWLKAAPVCGLSFYENNPFRVSAIDLLLTQSIRPFGADGRSRNKNRFEAETKQRICLKCGNEYLFNLIKAASDWTSKMEFIGRMVSIFIAHCLHSRTHFNYAYVNREDNIKSCFRWNRFVYLSPFCFHSFHCRC